MTNEAYHADISRIGSTGLKLLAKKTPAHYYAQFLDPNRVRIPQTAAMQFGSLLHVAILEPHLLEKKYIAKPEGIDRRTNAGKAAYADFELQANGKEIVSADDIHMVNMMRDSIYRHPAAKKLLEADDLRTEETLLFNHPDTGSPSKARLDAFNGSRNLIMDLKTTESAAPADFSRSIFNYMYHLQAAWYKDAFFYANGTECDGFVFVVVEKEPPFAVAVYVLDGTAMNIGQSLYMKHLQVYEQCRESGIWPAYQNTIETLQLPAWAVKQSSYSLNEDF